MREFGVACFTPEWDNLLMLAHYTSKHSGFAVEYDVCPMEIAIYAPAYAQFHMQYVSAVEQICLSEILFSPHQVLGRILGTKAVHWSSEKEWRLVHFEKCGALARRSKQMNLSSNRRSSRHDDFFQSCHSAAPAIHPRSRRSASVCSSRSTSCNAGSAPRSVELKKPESTHHRSLEISAWPSGPSPPLAYP